MIILMEATLFGVGIFPPPASIAGMLSGANGSGAGITANGNVTPGMERVERDLEVFGIGQHIHPSPSC